MTVMDGGELALTLDRVALSIAAAGLELKLARTSVRDREEALESLRLAWRSVRCAQSHLARVIVSLEPRTPVNHGTR